MPASWGKVTRSGARQLYQDEPTASEIWGQARADARRFPRTERRQERAVAEEGAERSPDRPVRPPRPALRMPACDANSQSAWAGPEGDRTTGPSDPSAREAPTRGREPARASTPGSRRASSSASLRSAKTRNQTSRVGVTSESRDPKVVAKLGDAARAYAADRYQDALRMLRNLAEAAPESAAVRELLGLTLYRLGRWPLALKELEHHHLLTGSYDQYPVMADCLRAMRHFDDADALWAELRQASPSAEVVAEGRLVAAGSLADRGDLQGAVKLLEPSVRRSKPKGPKPKGLNLRQWYALADLYERAGELPRARDLFLQIAASDPTAYDVRQRLVSLG